MRELILCNIQEAFNLLHKYNYDFVECTVDEFYDYLTGLTFTGDKTTLTDILDSIYFVVHEVIEIGVLKKSGIIIDKDTVMTAPRNMIYSSHFIALDIELELALRMDNFEWVKARISNHAYNLKNDEFLPERLKREGNLLYIKYKR